MYSLQNIKQRKVVVQSQQGTQAGIYGAYEHVVHER